MHCQSAAPIDACESPRPSLCAIALVAGSLFLGCGQLTYRLNNKAAGNFCPKPAGTAAGGR